MSRNWSAYNNQLVKRGEIYFSMDFLAGLLPLLDRPANLLYSASRAAPDDIRVFAGDESRYGEPINP